MTNEEIEAKVAELTAKYGAKVHPLVFKGDNEADQVVGFLKEPPRAMKLRIMDKALTEAVSSASVLVDAYLIKEESDARIYSELPENDKYYIGATVQAYKLIELSVNQFKKK